MKNIFLSTLTVLFILSSCSSKENEETILETPKLPISYEYSDGSGVSKTRNYIYDENNFLKESISTSDNSKFEFTYSNGKLITINRINSDGSIDSIKEEYEYLGNNISKYYVTENDILVAEEIYTYDINDVLISAKKTLFSNTTIEDYEYNSTNNSVKITERDNPLNYSITIFDSKNYVFSSIENLLPIFKTRGNKNFNNPLEVKTYSNGDLSYSETYVNEYDSDDFLIKATKTVNYGSSSYTDIDIWNYNK